MAVQFYLVVALVVGISCLLKNYIRAVWLALRLPGPVVIPFLGNVNILNDQDYMIHLANTITEKFKPIMRVWVAFIPFFFVYEPDHLQIIMSSSKVSKKNFFYEYLHNFLGNGLVTNNGSKWKYHRKLIQPYFHINRLQYYVSTFSEASVELTNKLEGKTDVNVTAMINECIFVALNKTVLGIDASQDISDSPYRQGRASVSQRIMRPWLLLESFFKLTSEGDSENKQKSNLHNFTRQILEKRKQGLDVNKNTRCLLDSLIEISENNPEFTDEDVINETCTFMLAGQDSSGSALAFSLHYIAANPDIQAKIKDEIDLFCDGPIKYIDYEQLNNMKYLEQCIKETLRLNPSIPIIVRELKEDVKLGENVLPKGTNVIVSPMITHRSARYHKNPLKYDPDRFSPGKVEKMHPYSYLPFSMGPRNCIGYKFAILELKTMIISVLKKYQISLASGHENVSLVYKVTLRARGGIWLNLKKR